ncbi:LmbE-like protein [Trichodelitschia bisporula]|uniref:N-acetylglucosaminylphosphatidylinositol deacetylase n=1 Tax=Trichodelitschia bisporula TaxID=703511 RepID=A0A6G1HSJ6_9PEZI|nr:LmbE-like protein [Trichodelitschia bisporula]
MNLLLLAAVPVFILGLWAYTALLVSSFPTLKNKRIVLLIAHPDDEAMFFAPTLLALTAPRLGNTLKILCLSRGDADGLGAVREKEIAASAERLGVRKGDVLVLDDPALPDSMTAAWAPERIAGHLAVAFIPEGDKKRKGKKEGGPEAAIDVLITFDQGGVSGHPNHIALYHGARLFIQNLMKGCEGWKCPVAVYTLGSVGLVRKYAGLLDVVVSLARAIFRRKEAGGLPTPLVCVSGVGGYGRARGAMTEAHRSQMRWFRWGWIGLSRYMYVNELVKVKVRG